MTLYGEANAIHGCAPRINEQTGRYAPTMGCLRSGRARAVGRATHGYPMPKYLIADVTWRIRTGGGSYSSEEPDVKRHLPFRVFNRFRPYPFPRKRRKVFSVQIRKNQRWVFQLFRFHSESLPVVTADPAQYVGG